jgi:hypothetical protein
MVATSCSAPVRRETAKRGEGLASALDLQVVGSGADRWTVHVLGVHSDGFTLWIQIATGPEADDSVTLKLSARATARHALAALAVVPRGRSHRTQIVPVMCTV